MAGKDADQVALGARLRNIRDYQGFTQEQVAQALGVLRPIVSMIEGGARRVTAADLKKLSRLYSLPVAYLLDEPVDLPAGSAALQMMLPGLDELDRVELLRFAQYLHYRKAHREELRRSS
jgi:transcriptional regulator with XRE-family HTH domain